MKKQFIKLCLMAFLLTFFCGCSTAISQYKLKNPGPQYSNDTCEMLEYNKSPIIFSGAYVDIHDLILFPFTASGEGGMIMMPFYPIILVIGVVDLPLSLVADTLILPYTIPYGNSLKCEEKARVAEENRKQRINSKTPLSFKGTVVDSETGMPIEGAIVLAIDYKSNNTNVIEGISDKEGKVSITGTVPLEIEFPQIMVYKKGYFAQSNWGSEYLDVTALPKFNWPDGYVFKLKKWRSKNDSWFGKKNYYHNTHYKFMYDVAATAKSKGKPMLMDSIMWEFDAPDAP